MSERTVSAGAALHARPASSLAEAAAGFASDVKLGYGDREGNAKSVLSILALDVAAGAEVTVRADGPDADEAVTLLSGLIATAGDVHA